MMIQTPKRKLKPAWLIALILTVLILGGLFIVPLNPGLRIFSYFIYFYICLDLGTQFYLSHKKNKRDETQKTKKVSGE